MSQFDDNGGLSSDFTVQDGDQKLWIALRPVWYGNEQGPPMVQVMYQDNGTDGKLQGPMFIDLATWQQVVRAVEWRRVRRLSTWKQFLHGMTH